MPVPKENHWQQQTDADQVVEFASVIAPGRSESVFDQSLGNGPECLSAEHLVQALFEGVTQANASHLVSCKTCGENMAAFNTTLKGGDNDVVAAALGKIESGQMHAAPDAARVVPAIISMENNLIRVNLERAVGLVCEIMPLGVQVLSSIDSSSIRASGALVGNVEPSVELIDHNRDGKPDSIRLSFLGLDVGKRVAGALKKDQSVSDTVQITGTLSDATRKYRFAGQMQVEFERESSVSTPFNPHFSE